MSEENIQCQMNSYLSGTIWVQNITLLIPTTTTRFSVMTPCRKELATKSVIGCFAGTLNTARKQWTRNMNFEWPAMISSGVCQLHRFLLFFFLSHIPMNVTVLHIAMYRYCWLLKLCNSNFTECWCFDQCVTSPVYYCDSYVTL